MDVVDYRVIIKAIGYVYEDANQFINQSNLKEKQNTWNALRSAAIVQRSSSAISSV